MKKKKNLSNPTVELLYQLNILNLTDPKTKTKRVHLSNPSEEKVKKIRRTFALPIKIKACKIN